MEREDRGHICFELICTCVVGKNPKTPNLNPMADDAVTWGGIRDLGTPLYSCGWHSALSVTTTYLSSHLHHLYPTPRINQMEKKKKNMVKVHSNYS